MTYTVSIDGESEVFTTEDGAQAAIRYIHDVVLAKRVGVLAKAGHLPGLDIEVLASYPEGTTLFARESVVVPGRDHVEAAGRKAALAFALGAITEMNGLDPLGPDDAEAFASAHSGLPVTALASAWHTWAVVRRAARNEAAFG